MSAPSSREFDLGIIGGGIAGSAVARDASLRGLRVLLLEKNTFGSGASSKSSKLIHGGIRYLELAWQALKTGSFGESWKNLRFVISALHESRILRRTAGSLVQPIPIFIPIYRGTKRSRGSIYLGAAFYGILSMLCGNARSPRIYFTARGLRKEIPQLAEEGLLGGIAIWDHLTDDAGWVRALIGAARTSGAQAFEHAEVISYTYDRAANVFRIRVKHPDGEHGYSCRKLVNASGAWADEVRARGGETGRPMIYPVSGCHLNTASFLPHSVLLEAEDGRLFFVIKIGETARIGTTERLASDPNDARATDEEIRYLLRSAKRYFPQAAPEAKDILSADAGIRPLAAPSFETQINRISREHELRIGSSGVIHLLGVKLTDHRRAAEEVVDRLIPLLLPHNPNLKKRSLTSRVRL